MRIALFLVAMVVGCSSPETRTVVVYVEADGATESGQDAPAEVSTDVGPEVGLDAATEAECEAGEGPEAGEDAQAVDAGCQPAPCTAGAWNCDPACGAMSPKCEAVCDGTGLKAVALPFGKTVVQVPAFGHQVDACYPCGKDGAWWSMIFTIPALSCGSMGAPRGFGVWASYAAEGAQPPGACANSGGTGCASFGSTSGPDPVTDYIVVNAASPVSVGSVITFDIRPAGECGSIACIGGEACSGD